MAGIFITFEGIEGSGKSTQLEFLAHHLSKKHEVVTTREPGGTAIGDHIRTILLDPQHRNLEPLAELLLYGAARIQHVRHVITPALAAGKIVLCDRFTDATRAYQGAARNLDKKLVEQVLIVASDGLAPDLTLLFDCPVEAGLARARQRNATKQGQREDRFEREAFGFHERVRQGYLAIALAEPQRVKVIDATAEVAVIHQRVANEVQRVVDHQGS